MFCCYRRRKTDRGLAGTVRRCGERVRQPGVGISPGEPVGPSRSLGAPADPRGLDRCTFAVPPSEGRCDLPRMHVCCQTVPLWTCPTCTGIRRFAAKLHSCPDPMKQGVSGNSARKQPTPLRTCGFHAQSATLHPSAPVMMVREGRALRRTGLHSPQCKGGPELPLRRRSSIQESGQTCL